MEAFEYLDKTFDIMRDLEKRLQIIRPIPKCVTEDPNNQASLISNCNANQRNALPKIDSIRERKIVNLSEKIDQKEEVSNIKIKVLPQTDSIRESTIVDLNENQPPSLLVSKIIIEVSELKYERNNHAFQTDSLKTNKINDLNNFESLSHRESNKIKLYTEGHESNIIKSLCCIICMTAECLPTYVLNGTKLCSHTCIIFNVERNNYLEYN